MDKQLKKMAIQPFAYGLCRVVLSTGALLVSYFSSFSTNYYINAREGRDSNKGNSTGQPWQSLAPLAGIKLQPGDKILFATGQHFTGPLLLSNVAGSPGKPIVISSYPYKGSKEKPVIDAGKALNTLHLQNTSYIEISGLEITATIPIGVTVSTGEPPMRCGIFAEVTDDKLYESIILKDLLVHDVYLMPPGFLRTAAETKSANGTQGYGWGIRFINNSKGGIFKNIQVLHTGIYRVSHTGLKATARVNGIRELTIAHCLVYQTGGPGMQFSGITGGHIHHNRVHHSGSVADSRNWGRGSGMWTWSCSNILIEHNRFENANGPGDSAGVHIDYNCSDVVVQYNLSANNAGGFCEILGNNYNCAYRYNISVNDGYRVKGENGAFQEGKVFWLSGYQGNNKKNLGPFNSYFYNNSIYVSEKIVPKIAVSSSASGVYIANNIFYFEKPAQMVAGDQKKQETDLTGIPNVVFTNNLFLRPGDWPEGLTLKDAAPVTGDPGFANKGGTELKDYIPARAELVTGRGVTVTPLPQDSIGLRIGLHVEKDILGRPVKKQPGLGAIEHNR